MFVQLTFACATKKKVYNSSEKKLKVRVSSHPKFQTSFLNLSEYISNFIINYLYKIHYKMNATRKSVLEPSATFNLFIKHHGSYIIIPCDKIGNRSSNPSIEKYAEECVKNKKMRWEKRKARRVSRETSLVPRMGQEVPNSRERIVRKTVKLV